jgi:hypothetical protein
LLNYLVSQNLNIIYISTNNDKDSIKNRGLIGAIKILMKLSSYFDFNLLKIKLPLMNDFSDMQSSGDNSLFENWRKSEPLTNSEIIDIIKNNESEFNRTKLNKFLKKCQNE